MNSVSVSLQELAELSEAAGFSLPETVLKPLAGYLGLLMQWNKVMNLVGPRTWRETFSTLVVDSLHLGRFLEELTESQPKSALTAASVPEIWDLGAGAGLPGLPLRMVWQKGSYWMIEAREKRALFLSTVLARHPLPGVTVYRGRAEAFMAGPPPRIADIVISRAFMPWPKVLELVREHLAPNALVVLLLREAFSSVDSGGWNIVGRHTYTVGQSKRHFCALMPDPLADILSAAE